MESKGTKNDPIYKNPQMEKKRLQSGRLRQMLKHLKADGVSMEQVAVDLQVTIWTVLAWLQQKRLPKYPVLRYIESKYKVKII